MGDTRLKESIERTMAWILQSFEATGYRGSAHSYSYWLNGGDGWSAPYPETTGYLLETLLCYQEYSSMDFTSMIRQQADWLLDTGFNNGAYPSGKYSPSRRTLRPSIFNTGQILFGLITAYNALGDGKYLYALQKSMNWLLDQRNPDGAWKTFAWREDYSPAYYSRVIWPILRTAEILGKYPEVRAKMESTVTHYLAYQNANGTFTDWGFEPDKPAFTHTIAYTLRGWLEIYLLEKNQMYLEVVMKTIDGLLAQWTQHHKIAGTYSEKWEGDYRFICVTGHIQLAIILYKLGQITIDQKFDKASRAIFQQIFPTIAQNKYKGGIPGSIPFYGKYNPLRYPNWAAKFFVDYGLMILK